MDEKKKKEFIRLGAGYKIGILQELIKSGERCICEEGEDCSINKALDFLKKHPDIPMEELAEVITSFELSLLEAQEEPVYVIHVSPLEILKDQEGEKGEGSNNAMEGLKKRYLEEIPCECGNPNCAVNLALDILKISGDQWEKVLVPLSKCLEGEKYFAEVICEGINKVNFLNRSLDDIIDELTKKAETGDCSGNT